MRQPEPPARLRQARAEDLSLGADADYLDRRSVAHELREAQQLMEQHGWRRIEASYLAVEEVARTVMHLIGRPTTELT